MTINLQLLLVLLISITTIAFAEPFVPEYEDQVIERLPESIFQSESSKKIKQLRALTQNQPNDWETVNSLAQQYIEYAQTNADPRYMGYAQALLQPWWALEKIPMQALIMRAIIRQNAHDFNKANADLEKVLSLQPGHSQANLIKATIATVQGEYQTAIESCRQLIRRSSMTIAIICRSVPASLSGHAIVSYQLLQQILSATPSIPDKQKVWAWTSFAEMAWRLGYFEAANQHFQSALETGIKDYYLLRVYADYLLQQQRPLEVIELLNTETENDSLLLRLALANQMTNSIQLVQQIERLDKGFNANRQRGSALHKGDEARFSLHLMQQPEMALELAKQNWQVQREPADTYILLQSAIASNDSDTIEQTLNWLKQQGTEDVLIDELLGSQKVRSYEM